MMWLAVGQADCGRQSTRTRSPRNDLSITIMATPANSQLDPEIIALDGEIDLHESPQVLERINPLIARKLPKIYLDMSRVSYIDSSGLAAFIDAMQRVQSYGGEFALIAMRESVRKIFEISRLDQVIKILPGPVGAAPSSAA